MQKDFEKTGLHISMAGSILLSVSAIIMAIIAGSEAVLLDGVYTFLAFSMTYISLKVIKKVKTPESRSKPFGYMAMEPFLNLVKGIIIMVMLGIFLVTNIQELISGGRVVSLDIVTYYILICLVIYAIVLVMLSKYKKKSESAILGLEIKIWRIDAILTVGIAISLIVAMILVKTGYNNILPYVDPVVVILISVASLPVLITETGRELKKLLLISDENDIEREVKKQISPLMERLGLADMQAWGLVSGRTYYLYLYFDFKEDSEHTVEELDKIRAEIFLELRKIYTSFWADIMFTGINPEKPFPYDNFEKL
jgi:predicted Co/Zn/Cd cation transporter (cation efflux family)